MSKDARENLVIISVQLWQWMWNLLWLRACLHGGGEPPVGQVTSLSGVKKYSSITCNLSTPPSRGALSQDYWIVAKYVNKKSAGKPRAMAINARLHSLAAFAATFSAVAFYCYL